MPSARRWGLGQRSLELQAGADPQLGENLAQVPLDGVRGQEQLGGDLRVGQARPGQPGNLVLLRGEVIARAGGARADGLADGQ